MEIKALFVNARIKCECYGCFEFVNGQGIAEKKCFFLIKRSKIE